MLVSFSVIAAESPLDVCLRALAVSPETQAAIADRILMVDFWASWCSPCRRAMPYLDSLYAEFGDAGLAVLAVGVDEEPAAAREFLDRVTVSYPVVLDMNGVCPRAFDVKAMPSTYFLDRSGRVRHVHRGFRERDRETLRAQARALLAE